ncbi:MAG TPA: disulfide bond formation protein B [Pusillimonas sp.]|jgi:disulfide bond formation protein DsbB|nr:disulfide bond formation protein B [Pusillimonas sp.]MBC43865.1 disulfide bond formation protein B [Pusillimonas sp.]HBT34327.1 disulfide bond formation protein B [Pusillimonas sp.]HCP78116.1 disulfide bond formation protein B [Pusillimonas sp.]|tara:strand:- start:110817 stop:111293 length:477 start_codon:yes stop_codon:yes gene_type:complete
MKTTTKLLHAIAFVCIGAVGVALVSQHVFGMQPCAWCVLQRLIYIVIALACWVGVLILRPGLGHRIAAGVALILSLLGVTAAWYQYSVAAHMFSCAQTFADRFMVASGLDANLPWLFGIYATCMDARINLMGLEYALWSMGLFAILAFLSVAVLIRRR